MRDEITAGEAARLLGVTPSRVRQLAVDLDQHGTFYTADDFRRAILDRPALPGRHFGRDWVFRRVDVKAYQVALHHATKDRQDRAAIAAGLRAHPAAKRRR